MLPGLPAQTCHMLDVLDGGQAAAAAAAFCKLSFGSRLGFICIAEHLKLSKEFKLSLYVCGSVLVRLQLQLLLQFQFQLRLHTYMLLARKPFLRAAYEWQSPESLLILRPHQLKCKCHHNACTDIRVSLSLSLTGSVLVTPTRPQRGLARARRGEANRGVGNYRGQVGTAGCGLRAAGLLAMQLSACHVSVCFN